MWQVRCEWDVQRDKKTKLKERIAKSAQADSEKFLKYSKSRKSAKKLMRPLDVEGVKGTLGNDKSHSKETQQILRILLGFVCSACVCLVKIALHQCELHASNRMLPQPFYLLYQSSVKQVRVGVDAR